MLKGKLLHPEILKSLGSLGHGSRVLIADGNFPFGTKACPDADRVFLNLAPGMVSASDTLSTLVTAIPIESALVMSPPASGEFAVEQPDIWNEFRRIIRSAGNSIDLDQTGRWQFYDQCLSPDCGLVIATGEQRIFANLLLTIGVVR